VTRRTTLQRMTILKGDKSVMQSVKHVFELQPEFIFSVFVTAYSFFKTLKFLKIMKRIYTTLNIILAMVLK
jgi:hypothetical protein